MNRKTEIFFRTAVLVSVLPLAGWTAPKFLDDLRESIPVPASKGNETRESEAPDGKAFVRSIVKAVTTSTVKFATASAVESIAVAHYHSTISAAEKRNQLVKHTDPRYQAVKDVFEDIRQAAKHSSYAKVALAFEWEIDLIEDSSNDNAFAWPGGKIVVYSGALQVARNKAGLAAILGHEVVHSLASHTVQRFDPEILKNVSVDDFVRGGSLDLDKLPPAVTAEIAAAMMYDATAEFSTLAREQELEADDHGLYLAALAGYDPDEGLMYWSRHFSHMNAGQKSSVLDTHPNVAERHRKMEEHKDELQITYQQAKTAVDNDKSLELLPQMAARR